MISKMKEVGKMSPQKEQIAIFFSEEELKKVTELKEKSGMSYKAILNKALNFYLDNDLPYIKSQYIFYSTIGAERKKRKQIRIDDETNQRLSDFCLQNKYSNSSVAAQAIIAFIREKGKDYI